MSINVFGTDSDDSNEEKVLLALELVITENRKVIRTEDIIQSTF